MSGDAPAEPVTSTAEIASNVIDSFESDDSTNDAPVADSTHIVSEPATAEPAAPETPATPAVVEPPAKELSAAAKFLESQGHKFQKVDGRPNWLPVKTVEGMLGRFVEQQQSSWHEARTSLESERNALKADLEELYSDVKGEPSAFLEKLANIDQRYKPFVAPVAQQPQSVVSQPLQVMPEPNVELPDGSRTYDLAGIQQLIEWAVDAKMMPKVDERLKPWAERDKAEKEAKAAKEVETATLQRARSQVEALTKMPMFGAFPTDGTLTPFQTEVFELLKSDTAQAKAEGRRPTMTPKEAYYEVERKKLTSDRNTQREEIIKEINGSAAQTPTVTKGGGGTPKITPGDTRSIAARTLERLERGS